MLSIRNLYSNAVKVRFDMFYKAGIFQLNDTATDTQIHLFREIRVSAKFGNSSRRNGVRQAIEINWQPRAAIQVYGTIVDARDKSLTPNCSWPDVMLPPMAGCIPLR